LFIVEYARWEIYGKRLLTVIISKALKYNGENSTGNKENV
jgi:hypothetical protein